MIYQELSFTRSAPIGCTRPSETAFLVVKLTSLPRLFGSLLLSSEFKFLGLSSVIFLRLRAPE